jgi:hypothetical protein
MAQSSSSDVLDDARHITLILRALVRRDGQIIHGEVIDADSDARSSFIGWNGLIDAIRSRIEPQE